MTPFAFTPSLISVPTFSPTLDGTQYTCTVTWNVAAQRYYLNCFNLSGERIFTVPVVESPPALDILAMSWDINTQTVQIQTRVNHGFPVGAEVLLLIENAFPSTYNGTALCLATGKDTLSYYLATNPGKATLLGDIGQLISMCAGYFNSTLIFRTGQFEVRP
jgi:hypothetical protein